MAVRSRDFVGIAEGIRSHELSTKMQIEDLKGHISELSGRRSSLNSTISYLEAAIAAAYEDTDEDGDPDYALIAALESERSSAKNQLSEVEDDLDSAGSELKNKQNELESVEEEKAQTLFEIQERARKTSNNINLAGRMYGAYAGVGSTLQGSLKVSLASLTQAAGILGGSVDGVSGGSTGGTSGSGNASTGSNAGNSGSEVGALAAFTSEHSDQALPLSASRFSSGQEQLATPATMPNYHSGQVSINTKKIQNFSTEQGANEYALSAFGDVAQKQVVTRGGDEYTSDQQSQNMESQFASADSPGQTIPASGRDTQQHTFADWLNVQNYTEDGHYIGAGQSWGYRPYGKDAGKSTATITPEQQALYAYMQEHNYGKWDYRIYSQDPTWQKLHNAVYPGSGNNAMTPQEKLRQYMYAHNYGWDDYIIYSRDPIWQRIRNEMGGKKPGATLKNIDIQYRKDFSELTPAVRGLRNKVNEFLGRMVKKSNEEQRSFGTPPVNQILAGKVPDNNQRYTILAQKKVGELTEKDLEEIKTLTIDTLKSQYGSFFSDQAFANVADKIEFLTPKEVKEKYPRVDFSSSGFHVAGKVVVFKKADAQAAKLISTCCHETLHLLSYTNKVNGVVDNSGDTFMFVHNEDGSTKKVRVSKNTGLNEGITEWLASENMKTMNKLWTNISYPDQVEIVSRLAQICGKDSLITAYTQHTMTALYNAMGRERTLEFCRKMDELYIYSSAKKTNEVKNVKADINAILDKVIADGHSKQAEIKARYKGSPSSATSAPSANKEHPARSTRKSSLDYIDLKNKPGFTYEEQRQQAAQILAKQKRSTSTQTDGDERERVRVPWEK